MTPRVRSAALKAASLLTAPRSLNELVTWRFSYFTHTCAPVSAESFGAGSIGVRKTCAPMVRRAASMSASVIVIARVLANERALRDSRSGVELEHDPEKCEAVSRLREALARSCHV